LIVIHAVEMALESIHVSGPEATELSEPHIHFSQWFRSQAVETALRVDRGFDEPFARHAQVLTRWLR
jgi:hypothetical protein